MRWSIARDDIELGLKTSAIAFGRFDVAVVMLCYAIYLAGMTVDRHAAGLGPIYYAGSRRRCTGGAMALLAHPQRAIRSAASARSSAITGWASPCSPAL